MVTSMSGEPAEIWRDYNKRGDMENRIKELKYDLAADDFCVRQLYATDAAFRSVLALFNLWRVSAGKRNGQVAATGHVADGGFFVRGDTGPQRA
jgi:hypothetical protein